MSNHGSKSTNKFHSVHGESVFALLGDGNVQYLTSPGKDRRRLVTVHDFKEQKAKTVEDTKSSTKIQPSEISINVKPFTPTKSFGIAVLVVHVGLSVGLACLATSDDLGASPIQLYNNYIGVALMMLVGFGYLMTFLKFYGLGAVGMTLLITVLGIEAALLFEPLFAHGAKPFSISIMSLLEGNFAAATFLISFGGVLGKVGPTETVLLVVLECLFYCVNRHFVLIEWLSHAGAFSDVGGTITIHLFGAYFGLACSYCLRAPSPREHDNEKSSMMSDVTSLVGTAFLWVYWPSFVAGALPPGTAESEIAITNTVLALIGSTIATFAASSLLNQGRLRPVDVQNATLAGGVAIGSVANFKLHPIGAIGLGTAAGLLSAAGYKFVQPCLQARLGLHDTCGIHNLHGMPALLGGLASVLLPLCIDLKGVADPGIQAAATVMTTLVAIASGALTGALIKRCNLERHGRSFTDAPFWEVAEESV